MVTKKEMEDWDKWMDGFLQGDEMGGWICAPHATVLLDRFRDDKPKNCPIVYWGVLRYGEERGEELGEQCAFLRTVTRWTGETAE